MLGIEEKEISVQNAPTKQRDLFGAEPRRCPAPGCGKMVPPGRIYCNHICRASAWRERRGLEKELKEIQRVRGSAKDAYEYHLNHPELLVEIKNRFWNLYGETGYLPPFKLCWNLAKYYTQLKANDRWMRWYRKRVQIDIAEARSWEIRAQKFEKCLDVKIDNPRG